MYGAIEAGGTKMVVAAGDENGNILKTARIPTGTPSETIPKILEFFEGQDIEAIGIGAFGPVCLDKDSADYGRIGKSPKLPWVGFSWKEAFSGTGITVAVDTDVNAACLGEVMYGSGKGLSDVIYITIGTGIGVGVYCSGELLHGMLHPEAGHILLPVREGDDTKGSCPYHKNCFEGLASGPAIKIRYGKEAFELLEREEVWELEADYISKALMQYICCYSPKRIILGGGVMNVEKLFPMIREKTSGYLNGYLDTAELKNMDNYIVPALCNGDQGIKGALFLAKNITGGQS
ncbi:ROK family protein [Butyrivibrio sp. FCS014]|uniref:ROK family protein n=1 Tax=Butyrivibrio sp. FCS014 TaxID=1408304 RepID=UPI0004660DF3|nr:ROK family protein [Butyrivibrio sp. FCS014]